MNYITPACTIYTLDNVSSHNNDNIFLRRKDIISYSEYIRSPLEYLNIHRKFQIISTAKNEQQIIHSRFTPLTKTSTFDIQYENIRTRFKDTIIIHFL